MSRVHLLCLAACCGMVLHGCVTTKQAARRGGPELARNGVSDFRIVVPAEASPSTKYAAEELQRFLKEITGAELPIVGDSEPVSSHEIILGNNAHLGAIGITIDFPALGAEGYTIKTVGSRLVIAGGDLRGTLYGVYGLLEDHLGCRWFTPEISRIPTHKTLTLPVIDETRVPVLEYREPFVMDCYDGDWCARNRMNSSAGRLEERHGGKVRFGAGMFVHTFNRLVPPEQYFDAHPEYFSLIDGKRVKDHSQLCCTNPDVIRLCTEGLRKAIEEDPGAFVYSVSQNDWGNYCQCAECQKLAEAEGSQMAPVLQLVNRVAEAIEQDYPDKAVETLAYQWTRKAPKTMRPRPNVIIRLCSIECCFMHPLATCDSPENTAFRQDAEAWAKVANRLWVWDYVTSFHSYLCPFPNHRVLDDNIRFFIEHNVRGIFEQDVYTTLNGELSSLGGYIIAKFLWNPDYDEDTAINEFLEGVYGKAAKPIGQYMDLLHDKVVKDNLHTNIWIGPVEAKYLTPDIMEKAGALWDRAEQAVADEPDTLQRVKVARLSYEYAWLEKTRGSSFVFDHARFHAGPDPAFCARVQRFFDIAQNANVTWLNEGRTTLDAYREGYKALLSEQGMAFTPKDAVPVSNTQPGLAFEYHESDGEWSLLPDFDAMAPKKTGVVKQVSIMPRDRNDRFGFRFRGFFKAPQDGVYSFHLSSNDGSRLAIHGETLIDNDGLHAVMEKNGMLALKAGLHPLEITYFESGASEALSLEYEGPGITRQRIPAEAFCHAPTP